MIIYIIIDIYLYKYIYKIIYKYLYINKIGISITFRERTATP